METALSPAGILATQSLQVKDWCQQLLCLEHYEFLRATDSDVIAESMESGVSRQWVAGIYNEYIKINSSNQINISHLQRVGVDSQLDSPDPMTIFSEVRTHVSQVLSNNFRMCGHRFFRID